MFILLFILSFAFSSDEFIKKHCSEAEYSNYLSFLKEAKNYSLNIKACKNSTLSKEVEITNLFNNFHSIMFTSLYSFVDINKALLASNICEALDKNHKPNSSHYAFFLKEAFVSKGFLFNYFKTNINYGIYFKEGNLSLFWSIVSHTLKKGFGCTIEEYLNLSSDSSLIQDILFFNNIYFVLEEELSKKEKEIFEEKVLEEKLVIDPDDLIDNNKISVYDNNNNEIINKFLRSLINTYFIKDLKNLKACLNNKFEDSIFLSFSITDSKFIFSDTNFSILENYCLQNNFNKNLEAYIKDLDKLKIQGIFNLNSV